MKIHRILILIMAALFLAVETPAIAKDKKAKSGQKLIYKNKKLLEQAIEIDKKRKKEKAKDTPAKVAAKKSGFSCTDSVSSVVLSFSNASLPADQPYDITFDSSSIGVEVYNSSNSLVATKYFSYSSGDDFDTVKTLISSAKLRKLDKPEGEMLDGGGAVTMRIYEGSEVAFSAEESGGLYNVDGGFIILVGKLRAMVDGLNEYLENPTDSLTDPITDPANLDF